MFDVLKILTLSSLPNPLLWTWFASPSVYWALTDHPSALTTCEGLFWLVWVHSPQIIFQWKLSSLRPGREGRGGKTLGITRTRLMWATGDPGSNSHRETFIQTEWGLNDAMWLGVMISPCINRDYWWGVMYSHDDFGCFVEHFIFCHHLCVFPAL